MRRTAGPISRMGTWWSMAGGSLAETKCCSQELAALVEHALLDDLIRPCLQRRRDREAEGLGGIEVDDQVKLGRLLDREIARICTSED